MNKFFILIFLNVLLSGVAKPSEMETKEPESILALKEKLRNSSDSLKVHLLSDLCYEYRLVSQDSALHYGNRALGLAIQIGYQNGQAQALNDMGIIFSDKMEIQTASYYYKKALSIWAKEGDSLRLAAMYNKLGILFQSVGKLDSAAYFQFQSLNMYDKLGSQRGKSQALNNIGIIFSNKGEYESAIIYHREALAIRRTLNDPSGIGSSLVNIGNIHFLRKEMKEASNYYREAIPLLNEQKAKNLLGGLYNNLGASLMELGILDSCKFYLSKSIEIRAEIGDTKGLTSSYQNLAQYEFRAGNLKGSKKDLSFALNLAESHAIYSSISEIHLLFVSVESAIGNFEKATNHALSYAQYRDSVLNQSSEKLVVELQTKYETEKKEQQIVIQETLLKEQRAENQLNLIFIFGLTFTSVLLIIILLLVRSQSRKKQALLLKEAKVQLQEALLNSAISSQEIERKRFARDLHDGFGQMISVLNINLRSLEKATMGREEIFENSAEVLDEMYKELKSICFNLMPETLIKSGVTAALQEFAGRINHANQVFLEVYSHGIDSRLSDLLEISLYRISQEWINNILKYSDATRITLQLTKDSSEITLMIEDNGEGFDKNLLLHGQGNGWKNIQSRANLIKGELELDTQLGTKGTTLILNIPVEISLKQAHLVGKFE